ncbi:AAA family ATPase [Gordonia amicalis]|uniref:AAA family ATPase n=1 Tax=Gordonia amicalis TaxID=89053 RepID=UPI002870B2D5|nr:AAA family ATPase [Gordonia amicalis]
MQARRLLALTPRIARQISAESNFVGRRREMAVVESMMDKTVRGQGCVMLLAGPPGLGKSRIARESAARAAARGFKVTWAFGDAHRRDVSFGVVAGLLRSALGLDDLDLDSARAQVLARFPNACAQDLSLLEDLLGIADPGVPLPAIEPDAKRLGCRTCRARNPGDRLSRFCAAGSGQHDRHERGRENARSDAEISER